MFVCFSGKHVRIFYIFGHKTTELLCCFMDQQHRAHTHTPHTHTHACLHTRTYTQNIFAWATVGLNRNCWPAGGSELMGNIWAQLDRVGVWSGSTIETCRIGGLGPFGKAAVGSRSVSDTEVSGVSQLMIQER